MSKLMFVFLLVFAFPMFAMAQAADDVLRPYQWKNRVVLVFNSAASDSMTTTQQRIFKENSAGMKERDLKVFYLVEANASKTAGEPITPNQQCHLRASYEPKGFTVILIGKDGVEKLRTHKLLAAEKLFSTIDAMPMRQREMRQNEY